MSADEQAKAARLSAAASLERMGNSRPQLVLSYLITYVTRTLTLSELAELVTALDRATAPEWTDTGSGAGWPAGSGVVELPDNNGGN